jgi:VWFA-related protein
VIALVFDRLTSDSRALAHSAAIKYLGEGPVAAHYMAVYGIDLRLIPYQNFTRDTTAIRKAIDAFGSHSSSQYGSVRESLNGGRQDRAGEIMARAEATAAEGGPAAAQAMANIGAAAAEAQFAEMQASMEQTFAALERDQAGYSTSNALLAVVNGMRAIPGRKSIVFFSEGLAIPPNVLGQFRSVIAAANRANVSIYPMDAMGLRTDSSISQTRDEMMSRARQTLRRTGRDQAGPSMLAALERNEDLLRMNPHAGLGDLAESTGGFLIANTNDLWAGFRRIETDMRNYYLLTYVPQNDAFDGRFREIAVKVRRPGVRVHARNGYFAFREGSGLPVRDYEVPALTMLERTPVPNAFPVRAAALRFPENDHPNLLSVVVELPTSYVTFRQADDKASYTSDFTILVRFTDDSKQVIDKLSQRYELTGPLDQIERAKRGQVLFYRQPELIPGVYTMETVAYDALSRKASVRFTTIEQREVDSAQLRMSSLVLVRRGETVDDPPAAGTNPLFVGNTMIYPKMGQTVTKGADKELAFFFTAYPAMASQAPVSATIEMLQNAQVIARAPLSLSAADPGGRVQQVSRVPIDALAPGSYQLRVIVQQGETSISRAAEFRIVS